MSAFLDPHIEERADQLTLGTIVAMAVIGAVGAIAADNAVPLQFDGQGFTTYVPALVAAVIYPGAALLIRSLTSKSSVIWARWLGRMTVLFLAVVEILAFMHAA